IAAIEEYIRYNNENPKPFVWTKRAEDIIKKVASSKAIFDTLH
ncbi:MAG: Endonuclease DDE, partial [Dehalococcoidia bacterium]|nr:Endonuclease DDE [Dehalococcoidia bacterium]